MAKAKARGEFLRKEYLAAETARVGYLSHRTGHPDKHLAHLQADMATFQAVQDVHARRPQLRAVAQRAKLKKRAQQRSLAQERAGDDVAGTQGVPIASYAFGSADFQSSFTGARGGGAPTVAHLDHVAAVYQRRLVSLVNEHLTTRCHAVLGGGCGHRMVAVLRDPRAAPSNWALARGGAGGPPAGRAWPVHGMLFCPVCGVLVPRDPDASGAILDAEMAHLRGLPRPDYIQRMAGPKPTPLRPAFQLGARDGWVAALRPVVASVADAVPAAHPLLMKLFKAARQALRAAGLWGMVRDAGLVDT